MNKRNFPHINRNLDSLTLEYRGKDQSIELLSLPLWLKLISYPRYKIHLNHFCHNRWKSFVNSFLSEGGETASIQSRFNYAWGLIKSMGLDDQRLGIKLLTDIYKESPQRRRECLYYLTIGCYKIGEYSMAKRYVDTLLEHEPGNHQIKALQGMVEDKIQRETVRGVAVATGVVASAAAVAAFFFRRRR